MSWVHPASLQAILHNILWQFPASLYRTCTGKKYCIDFRVWIASYQAYVLLHFHIIINQSLLCTLTWCGYISVASFTWAELIFCQLVQFATSIVPNWHILGLPGKPPKLWEEVWELNYMRSMTILEQELPAWWQSELLLFLPKRPQLILYILLIKIR